jgi:hypothetical protein
MPGFDDLHAAPRRLFAAVAIERADADLHQSAGMAAFHDARKR